MMFFPLTWTTKNRILKKDQMDKGTFASSFETEEKVKKNENSKRFPISVLLILPLWATGDACALSLIK